MIVAHGIIGPGQVWSSWNWDPVVIVGLVMTGLVYGVGVRRLRARGRRVSRPRVACLYAGLAMLGLALLSPLDALGETLFSVHMVQHLALILGAAPLLAYGLTTGPLLAAFPPDLRRAFHALRRRRLFAMFRRILAGAAVVVSLHALALWGWHLPFWYESALDSRAVHAAEHLSFLLTGFAFWRIVVGGGRRRYSYGVAIFCVFVTALQSGVLGAVLTFASQPLYAKHVVGARAWELTAIADQQLAGVIMWVPAGTVYLVVMAGLFLKWLNLMERRMRAAEVNPLGGAGHR
jgi:putative membrane protein